MTIQARVTDGRLHLYTYEGTSGKSALRELDVAQLAMGKTGIAVRKWYHLFAKSVKLRIGNKTYDINAKSFEKYLLRTSGIQDKDHQKYQDIALKAFKSKASNIFGVDKQENNESSNGLMLLRHAKVLDLRQNPRPGAQYSSLDQIAIERREELTQKSVWEEFFQREVSASDEFHRNERVAQKYHTSPHILNPLEKFLQAFNESCELARSFQGLYPSLKSFVLSQEDREEILNFAQSLHPERLKELAEKMAASNKLIKTSAPYIQLKIQEKRLAEQEESLRLQVESFDERAAQKNEAYVFFQTVLQVLRGNLQIKEQTEAMVEIPEMAIEKIKAENATLAQQLANYNRELNKFQEDHRLLKEQVELFERNLARRNSTYLHYAELRSTAKLMLTGCDFQLQRHGLKFEDFVAQYKNVGLSTIRQDINSFQRDIETNKAYAKDPLTNLEIEVAQNHLDDFNGQIKLLKSHPKPKDIDLAIEDLRAQINELNLRYIELQTSLTPEEVSSNLSLQQQLKTIKRQRDGYEERLEIYTVLKAKGDTSHLLRNKQEAVAAIKVDLQHLKEKKEVEVKARKQKCKELQAVIKELEKIEKMKTKEFQTFANQLAKEENIVFKGDLETQVTNYLREKKGIAQADLHSLMTEVRTLNEQKERSLERIQTNARNVEIELVSSQPEKLTPEQKNLILQEYGQISQQLSEVKQTISQTYHIRNEEVMDSIKTTAGKRLSLKEAFAFGTHAHLLNLEFLMMAAQFQASTTNESKLITRREQTLHRAKKTQELFTQIGLEYPSDKANLSMFVFSGAQHSLFDKFPDQLRKMDHPSYLMRRFFNYLRENSFKDNESIDDNFSQISVSIDKASSVEQSSTLSSLSVARSLTDPVYPTASSSPSFRSMSFTSTQASTPITSPLDFESPDRYAMTFNPAYQQLISDIDPKIKQAKEFVLALEDWDIHHFTIADKSMRLDPQQHQPLLCPATNSLYSLFIGGDTVTGVQLNYPAMIHYLDQEGESLARSIRERQTEQNPIPPEELSVILSYHIFAAGLKNSEDPRAQDKFINQVEAMCPGVLEILRKHKIIQ